MPVRNGAIPEAPLGGHTTQFPAPPEPARPPAVDRPPPLVVPAAPDGAAAPPRPPPPPPAEPVAVAVLVLFDPPPAGAVVPAAPVLLLAAPAGLAKLPEAPGEAGWLGKVTAPPPLGKPLRSVALPTEPPPGEVAVCAAAGIAKASDRAAAIAGLRVISGQRERS